MNKDFDAIVIGSGVTGGWAAKELTEKGLQVLMLDRGRMVEHGKDYTGEHTPPWKMPYAGKPLRDLYASQYPIQSKNYAFDETTRHFWNNDKDNPYDRREDTFNWLRADVVGGKSLLWGRQVYRWSDLDFAANKHDGHGIDWPIRYADVEPWYRYVEEYIGVSGQSEGLAHLPDSVFQPPMEMNAGEQFIKKGLAASHPDRTMTIGRVAVRTKAGNGRGACHYCGPCQRGCSAGAYFSTQSTTLPAARATGRLTLLADSVVEGIDYDPASGRASGVRVIDAVSGSKTRYTGKLIFLCASTVASNQILLNSSSDSFPNGLGNRSGALGKYLMDHTMASGAFGMISGMTDRYFFGNRPNGIYVPRFRNVKEKDEGTDFVRGYGFQGSAMRPDWRFASGSVPGIGIQLKEQLRAPGPWAMTLMGFGECLPYEQNRVYLSQKKDRFGIPQAAMDFSFGDNENRMREDMTEQATDMLKQAGCSMAIPIAGGSNGGDAIHEMGGARMGDDPQQSVLNKWNQMHDVPNLFVTDGACMTSSACVNPSLTFMALTARATDYAAKQLHEGRL